MVQSSIHFLEIMTMTYRPPESHRPSYPEGVLGRLMRAFPARTLSEADALEAVVPAPATVTGVVVEQRKSPIPDGLVARLDAWLWRRHRHEREAYLSGARAVAEIEARMRRFEPPRPASGDPIR
jgi:hypothetical protein